MKIEQKKQKSSKTWVVNTFLFSFHFCINSFFSLFCLLFRDFFSQFSMRRNGIDNWQPFTQRRKGGGGTWTIIPFKLRKLHCFHWCIEWTARTPCTLDSLSHCVCVQSNYQCSIFKIWYAWRERRWISNVIYFIGIFAVSFCQTLIDCIHLHVQAGYTVSNRTFDDNPKYSCVCLCVCARLFYSLTYFIYSTNRAKCTHTERANTDSEVQWMPNSLCWCFKSHSDCVMWLK